VTGDGKEGQDRTHEERESSKKKNVYCGDMEEVEDEGGKLLNSNYVSVRGKAR